MIVRELFEKEVDNFCRFASVVRPRCKEWVEFTERFVARYEQRIGCWVAETAVKEWYLYMQMPEGKYEAIEMPEGWDFRA